MYLFSRFSPYEWENPFPCQENYEYLENDFNLPNAFWFSVGSIMQQGMSYLQQDSNYCVWIWYVNNIPTINRNVWTGIHKMFSQILIRYHCQSVPDITKWSSLIYSLICPIFVGVGITKMLAMMLEVYWEILSNELPLCCSVDEDWTFELHLHSGRSKIENHM